MITKKCAYITCLNFVRKNSRCFMFQKKQDENAQNGLREWLGDDKNSLDGFSWRGGCERETSGILLWSEPYLTTLPTGEKV